MAIKLRLLLKYLTLGFFYIVWIKLTDISVPCPIHTVTGYYCPGCGVTTMFLCLAVGDFYGAFSANPALFTLSPIICWLIVKERAFKANKKKPTKIYNSVAFLTVIILIVYGFVRNL